MPDMPTIRAEDVSPESVYLLSKSAKFVVALADETGKRIWSQHRVREAAAKALKELRGHWQISTWKRLAVYRVER